MKPEVVKALWKALVALIVLPKAERETSIKMGSDRLVTNN